MSRIVVMGESLVDVVGETSHPGGSPLNVAVGLARLSHPVTFHTEFGRDAYGQQILEHLLESEVRLAVGSISDNSTSRALVTIDQESNAHYEFDIHQEIPALTSHAPELLHAGSIAAWIDPSARTIINAFKNSGPNTLRSYDPNLRPSLVEDRATTIARIEELMSLSHIVKLSDMDAAWLYPQLTHQQTLEHITALGAGLAVMTLGPQGALALSTTDLVELPAFPTTLVDTIGAGDAFMSGLLHGVLTGPLQTQLLAHQKTPQQAVVSAVRHALASAALTVAQPGANPPRLHRLTAVLATAS